MINDLERMDIIDDVAITAAATIQYEFKLDNKETEALYLGLYNFMLEHFNLHSDTN